MRKLLIALCLGALAAIMPATATAQQTREEATDSVKNILSMAKKGDAVAQNVVGGWYYRGRHVKQDYEEAIQWWSKSAKQGNARAIGNMALCYRTGHGIEQDSVKAFELYLTSLKKGNKPLVKQMEEMCAKGDVFSNMLMATCYYLGIGVEKSSAKAIEYYTAAAKKNSLRAIRELSVLLLNEKKPKEAAPWLKKGAEAGDPVCTFYYGQLLLEGRGVKADKKDGANYMLRAAEAGNRQAMFTLGECYMNGEGLTKNAEQAVKWYKLAAGKGVSKAQWALAECYRTGNGTAENYDQALYWYAEASATGHARALKRLLTDSIAGSPFVAYIKGVKAYGNKDFEEALKQFKVVEKAGVPDGKVMEAAIMANSNYEKHNMKKGIKLLNDAAKTNAQAMYLLAVLYEAGKGVDKNMDTAVDYMTKAAEMGYGAAQCALADMYYEGRGVDQDYEKAVKLYEEAYAQGQLTENAASRYATCLEEGKGGLTPDKQKAKAILNGNYKSHISDVLKLV